MKNHYAFLFLLAALILAVRPVSGQGIPPVPALSDSHQQFIRHLRTAEERAYQDVLARYDAYLSAHPEDVAVHLERCRFIGTAFYPENAEYNLKQDEFDQSLRDLSAKFPDHPDVLLYRSEFLYGDSAIAFLEDILARYQAHPDAWQGKPLWKVYESLANSLSYEDKLEESIEPALKAVSLNDTLDLSLLLARAYQQKKQLQEAREVLGKNLKAGQPYWTLAQKGRLLLELDDPVRALEAFRLSEKDSTGGFGSPTGFAKALEKTGAYAEARTMIQADAGESAGQPVLEALFLHDLRYQPADSALASYNKLRELGYQTDPLGRYRLALFLRHPLLGWHWRDAAGIGLLLLVIAGFCLVPYVWVLPVHFIGSRFRRASAPAGLAWGLRHFWLVSAAYLLVSLVSIWLFDYAYILSLFSDGYATDAENDVPLRARAVLMFFGLMALATVLLVRRQNWSRLLAGAWTTGKQIGAGIGAAIGLRILLGVSIVLYRQFFPETPAPAMLFDFPFATIEEDILALKDNYGLLATFLCVAVLVPIYEEVIFRGIILGASQRYILFLGANALQSLLFALVHDNFSWFLFHFAFGIIAGYLRKRSGGLGSGIVFHATNNALALVALVK